MKENKALSKLVSSNIYEVLSSNTVMKILENKSSIIMRQQTSPIKINIWFEVCLCVPVSILLDFQHLL